MKQPFEWGPDQSRSFAGLKRLLASKSILKYPDFDKELILATDASNVAVGAVLSQLDEEGDEHPVAYASRVLIKVERNFSTTEREALAIFWAVKHFHPYLHNIHFRVITDHQALRWLKLAGDNVPKLMRWIYYKNGKRHTNADAMSRLMSVRVNTTTRKEKWQKSEERYLLTMQKDTCRKILKLMQRQDLFCKAIVRRIKGDDTESVKNKAKVLVEERFVIENELVYRKEREKKGGETIFQLVVPIKLVPEILFLNHDHELGGHLGTTKIYYRIKKQYFWKNMYSMVDNYCLSCEICAKRRLGSPRPIAPLGSLQPVSFPFERGS